MFVYLLVGRRKGGELYVIAVYATEEGARVKKRRWLEAHAGAEADVQRFTVLNGEE